MRLTKKYSGPSAKKSSTMSMETVCLLWLLPNTSHPVLLWKSGDRVSSETAVPGVVVYSTLTWPTLPKPRSTGTVTWQHRITNLKLVRSLSIERETGRKRGGKGKRRGLRRRLRRRRRLKSQRRRAESYNGLYTQDHIISITSNKKYLGLRKH